MDYAGLTLDGLRNRTCIARTMCELLLLGKEELHSLLQIEAFRSRLHTMLLDHLSKLEVKIMNVE